MQILIYDPVTMTGLSTMRAAPRKIEQITESYVIVADDLEITDPGQYAIENGVAVHVPLTPAEVLERERAGMSCSPLQGSLALGETIWAQVEALLADPQTPFAMRRSITSATVWERNSPMIDELAWLMQLTETEVDDLFRAAMAIIT